VIVKNGDLWHVPTWPCTAQHQHPEMEPRHTGSSSATKSHPAASPYVSRSGRGKEWTWMAANAFAIVAFFLSGLLLQI